MSEQRRSERVLASLTAGVVIGVVEVVLAISFAALVFGGYLAQFLPDGIGLYLVAAALTLAILAWRAGARGVVGSVQDAAAAVLAVVATTTALATFGSPDRAFLTVIAATMVVTLLDRHHLPGDRNVQARQPDPVRAVPGRRRLPRRRRMAPPEGRHLRRLACGGAPGHDRILIGSEPLKHWLPALAFGVILLLAVRLVKQPLVIPIVLAVGLALFAIGMLVTGSSLEDARTGLWLLGPFRSDRLFQPWTVRALTGADWSAVLGQAAGIATVVFVAVIGVLFNISGTEIVLHRDLDTNRELRDAGVLNVVSGAFGGIPGYHALSLTALAERMNRQRAGRRARRRARPALGRRVRRRRSSS